MHIELTWPMEPIFEERENHVDVFKFDSDLGSHIMCTQRIDPKLYTR